MTFTPYFFVYLLIMAGVTYLVRALPLLLVRRKIENRFIRSFLYYVPYAVLSVMTVPAIFYSTGSLISAAIGTLMAVCVALLTKGNLVLCAAAATVCVLLTELALLII